MALQRPSLQQLRDRAEAETLPYLPGASPALRRGFIGPLMRMVAGLVHGLYGALAALAPDLTPYSATGDARVRWAALFGIRPLPPAAAVGSFLATGVAGSLIPAETTVRSKFGLVYAVDEAGVIAGDGTATLTITAVQPGAASNLTAGEQITFMSAPVGVNARGTVNSDSGLQGGADLESTDRLWARLLRRLANPPHGGNQQDYVEWAMTVPSVTRAWAFSCYRGPGSVRVYIVNDDYDDEDTASAADISAVQTYIGTQRPVGMQRWGRLTAANFIDDPDDAGAIIPNPANLPPVIDGLEVVAPTKHVVTPTISNIADLEVRAAMQSAFEALLLAQAVPEGGVSLTAIITALGNVSGSAGFAMSAPAASPSADAGEILWPGEITWT